MCDMHTLPSMTAKQLPSVLHPTSSMSSKILKIHVHWHTLCRLLTLLLSRRKFHQGNDHILNPFIVTSPWGEDGGIKTWKEHRWEGWGILGYSSIPGIIMYFVIYIVIIQLCSLCVISSSCTLKTCVSPYTYISIMKSLIKNWKNK